MAYGALQTLSEDLPSSIRRTPSFVAHDDAQPLNKHYRGEKALLVAVLRRAVADAKGVPVASDSYSVNNRFRVDARKWFKNREQTPMGWGWIIDWLDLSEDDATRIEKDAGATLRIRKHP